MIVTSARVHDMNRFMAAFEAVLRHEGFGFTPGAGVDAALAVYEEP